MNEDKPRELELKLISIQELTIKEMLTLRGGYEEFVPEEADSDGKLVQPFCL